MKAKVALIIYVADNCPSCAESRRLARQAAERFPHVEVKVVNMDEPTAEIPDLIFATPTFVLADQIISIGNPSPRQLAAHLQVAT